jgi:hypothetical protein
MFGSRVVNGNAAIFASAIVSAEKNVLFPALGFPTTPIVSAIGDFLDAEFLNKCPGKRELCNLKT